MSGPAKPDASGAGDIVAEKAAGTQDVASAFPFNPTKRPNTIPIRRLRLLKAHQSSPPIRLSAPARSARSTAPTRSGAAGRLGQNPTVGALDRVRVDSTHRVLTTNQGVAIADNQSSLKAGLRGPTLLEDFILREKITHFDHERIPERIVHARGSAAHGFFECTKAMPEFTRASLFGEVGKQTPVFVRFSTVLGERGSTDTARDVRGFDWRKGGSALRVDGARLGAAGRRHCHRGGRQHGGSSSRPLRPLGASRRRRSHHALRADGRTLEFIKDQYRHCKPILAVGAGGQLLTACGIETALPDGPPDPG